MGESGLPIGYIRKVIDVYLSGGLPDVVTKDSLSNDGMERVTLARYVGGNLGRTQ